MSEDAEDLQHICGRCDAYQALQRLDQNRFRQNTGPTRSNPVYEDMLGQHYTRDITAILRQLMQARLEVDSIKNNYEQCSQIQKNLRRKLAHERNMTLRQHQMFKKEKCQIAELQKHHKGFFASVTASLLGCMIALVSFGNTLTSIARSL